MALRRWPGPLAPQWEAVVNAASLSWVCFEMDMWEHFWHELDMMRNATQAITFNRPSPFTEEH